jgi:type IX secretion system PorP/SprF family membrane protein
MGIQFMNDRSMKGTLSGNSVSVTAAYHITLDEAGRTSLGAGLMGTYMNRRIDLAALTFDEQFSSGGFLQSLPTGEAALQQLKPYVTVGAGLLFLYNAPESGTFFELGASGFHFSKPQQTVLKDENQYVPIRYSLQASLQKYLGDRGILNLRFLYQTQAAVEYLTGGGTIGLGFGGEMTNVVGAGLFYRSQDAVTPYLYVEYDQLMLGLSYDATVSGLKQAARPIRSMEFSLQWRFGNKRAEN